MIKKYNIVHMSKVFSLMLFASFAFSSAFSQSEPMYSQYMYNMAAINPAYAGNRGATNLNYFGRSQWSGIPGAPKTHSLSLDGTTLNGNFGLGVQLYNDQIGVFKTNGAHLMASTRVRVSDNGVLSGGIQVGLMNQRKNFTDVANIYDKNDPMFMANQNITDATFGLGLFYNTDKFYAGASIPNILNSTYFNTQGNNKETNYHLFITTGYVFDINESVKLKPSALMKVVRGAPFEFDINANVWLKEIIGLGLSYRTGDALVGMAELQLSKQLRIGYAYDYTISDLRTIAGSTNEIMFRLEFGKETKNIKSTRYF